MTQDRPHAQRPAPRPARRGFTLLELLIVIGILLLLIGLAVIGFRTVGSSAKGKVSRNAIENAKSLFSAYELTNRLQDVLPVIPVTADNLHWYAPPAVTPDITMVEAGGLPPPAVSAGATPGSALQINLKEDTARVMQRLRAVPENRQSLEKMAADRLANISFNPLVATSGPLPGGSAPVLLDGFGHADANGNPDGFIYFVPGGGLNNVNLGYKGTGSRADPANYDHPRSSVFAPDRRPFWVSAGPDGDLTTGDDNVYSFGE